MAVAAFVLLFVTAAIGSASLRLRGFAAFLLAAYLVGAAEVVGLTLVLSPFKAATASGYLVGEGLLGFAVLVVWWRVGRPFPRLPMIDLRTLVQHPLLLTLAVTIGMTAAFQLFLAIVVPPNNWDSMTYHLPRAAAWYQHHAVGYIAHANTERLNIFPANGEIATLYTFALVHSDRVAALPQYLAGIALLAACYATARGIGFARSASIFAALILGSLSQVALQATTTQNDLIVASFVAAAAAFVLDGSRRGLGVAGLAIGLAVGTKTTALFALPLLGVLALTALRRRQIADLASFAVGGVICFGSLAYAENIIHTGSVLGSGAEQNAFRPDLSLAGVAERYGRILDRFLDLPGFGPVFHSAVGLGALLVVLITGPPALWLLERRFGHGRVDVREPDARLLVALAPIAVLALGALEWAAGIHVGVNLRANEDLAFFGTLGAALLLPVAATTIVRTLRRRSDLRPAALAFAIPVFGLELAVGYQYNDWIGRFMIIPVAMSVPLVAAAYPARKLAAASAVLAGVGCFTTVAFNERKPTGLAGTTPIWSMSRTQAVTIGLPGMQPIIRAVDRAVPQGRALGIVLGPDDWSYPFYGGSLDRKLVYLNEKRPFVAAERSRVQAVLFARDRRPLGRSARWQSVRIAGSGWTLSRRTAVLTAATARSPQPGPAP